MENEEKIEEAGKPKALSEPQVEGDEQNDVKKMLKQENQPQDQQKYLIGIMTTILMNL